MQQKYLKIPIKCIHFIEINNIGKFAECNSVFLNISYNMNSHCLFSIGLTQHLNQRTKLEKQNHLVFLLLIQWKRVDPKF